MQDLTTWWVWIPFYLMLAYVIIKNTESVVRISMTFGCIALCMVLTQVLAYLCARPYFANIFGFVTLITLLVRSSSLGIFMSVWAVLLCIGKIYLGSFTVWSIGFGVGLGVGVAFLFYWLLRYLDRRGDYYSHRRYVSRRLTVAGYSLGDVDQVLTILVITAIVIIIHSVIKA